MASGLRLVIFDCDGTMVDSHAGIYDAVCAAWQTLALDPPSREQARHVVGLSLGEAIATLAPDRGAVERGHLERSFREAFVRARAEERLEEPLYPGLVEALDAIEADGALLGVATGKSHRGLRRTLERHGLERRFVTLQTSDRVPGKPRPDMVIRAMAETGAEAGETVVIGDTSYDMEMAANAGVTAIGVAWGYHPTEELLRCGAATVLDRYDQAAPAVRRAFGSAS